MTTVAAAVTRDEELRLLSEQMPRFMRLIHGIKAQHTAEGGRDLAALILLFPLQRLGPLRQSALAEAVHADPSTVSRHVALLVERGLVLRVADESDGRASRLVLTDAGHAQLDQLRVERVAYLRTVTSDWTDDELESFTTLFDRLLDGIALTLPGEPPSFDLPDGDRMTSTRSADRRSARAAAAAPSNADGSFTHRQILTILAGLMLGMFLAALDQTVVSTAIRTIADDLQGYDLQAWATTAFLITSTISTPLYGKLSDLYGRRPFYLFAIGVFVVGSMLCGLADSMYQLAAFRAIQGIGAGGLMSLALAIIGDIVPPRERSRYQGFFMAVFGTSSVLGPVIGGFLAGQESILGITGWRWIFYVNVPLGLLAFVVVMRVLHLPHTRRDHRIDWPGALALITCLVPLLIVAEQGRTWGWDSGWALLCYAIGVIGLIAFILTERAYGDDALLPLRLFRNRSFAVGSVGSIVLGAGMFGGILLLPQYLQIVHGSSPTVAGLQMIPLVAGIMAGAMGSGIAISRTGKYKIFPLVGIVFIVVALTSMSFIVEADTSVWSLVPFMVLMGLGLGFNFQPVILAVQNAVSPREMGVATSSVTFFRQMGGTIGVAAFLSILFTRLPTDIREAFESAAATDPRVAEALQSGQVSSGGDLSDTSFIQDLPSYLALPFKVGFSNTIDLVFLVAAAVVAIGFFVLIFLPQLTLSDKSGIQAQQQGAAAGTATSDPADAGEQAVESVGAAAPTSTAPPVGRPGDTPRG